MTSEVLVRKVYYLWD